MISLCILTCGSWRRCCCCCCCCCCCWCCCCQSFLAMPFGADVLASSGCVINCHRSADCWRGCPRHTVRKCKNFSNARLGCGLCRENAAGGEKKGLAICHSAVIFYELKITCSLVPIRAPRLRWQRAVSCRCHAKPQPIRLSEGKKNGN